MKDFNNGKIKIYKFNVCNNIYLSFRLTVSSKNELTIQRFRSNCIAEAIVYGELFSLCVISFLMPPYKLKKVLIKY